MNSPRPYILLHHDADAKKWALVVQIYGAPMQQAFLVTGERDAIVEAACQAIDSETPLAIEVADGSIDAIVPLPRNAYVRVIPAEEFEKQVAAAQKAQAAARFGIPPGHGGAVQAGQPFIVKR